ncbi:MAG: CoB--CoM heterodisulfide reductase iron-sulfur subunit B family protein [Deltaproteobacteria bacterium]|nr:CoB--CoM heterodisulfide reductase iron-sulfur subunit B family protein [Deltaproteobacteria bacterium]
MKDFTIFWGCTIQARFPFIEKSVRTVLKGFGLPYRDIDGFTCCPEKSLVNNVDHGLWLLTAARNMAVAEKEGVDIVSPCTGCVSNLATVKGELHGDAKKEADVNSILKEIGREFHGTASLKHLVPFFHDEVGINAIKAKIKRGFEGMKIGIHYGCHMMRPSHALKNDDPLEPKKFDNLVRALGAESLSYLNKLKCCGQSLDRVDQHDAALNMARVKLNELRAIGADAMVLCCPSCFLQFDNNQFLMARDGEKLSIPILYFTDLLGLAMGYKPEELGMDGHRMDVAPFLEKWNAMEKKNAASTLEGGMNMEGAF